MKKIILAAILFTVIFSNANAQTKLRTKNQHQRIRHGIRSGELTKKEARNLALGQKDIRQDIKMAKADGVITKAERREIRKDKRQQNRKIFRKKNNKRDSN